MPKILNPDIYENAKKIVYSQYAVPSAYRSMALVKRYKQMGGKYSDDKQEKKLTRWMNEKWKDINPNKSNHSYPVFRPTKKINKQTPLTVNEISKSEILKQSKLKQKIKSDKLPDFKKKK